MEDLKPHTYKWYEFGCKDASYLVTKEEYAGLKLSEKLLLKFHMATCKYCRRFVEQVKLIEGMIKKGADLSALQLSDARKHSIDQLITEKLKKK